MGADMSMISAQCDKLRGMADELAMVTKGIRSGVPVSTWRGATYVFEDSARSLRSAADTIWELRNKLADMVDQREEVERLKKENAKLRALCKDLYGQVKADDSTWEIIRRREDELPCYADHFIAGYDCSLGKVRIADGFADRMRELGVGIDR